MLVELDVIPLNAPFAPKALLELALHLPDALFVPSARRG